jgi:hypothetical protein
VPDSSLARSSERLRDAGQAAELEPDAVAHGTADDPVELAVGGRFERAGDGGRPRQSRGAPGRAVA